MATACVSLARFCKAQRHLEHSPVSLSQPMPIHTTFPNPSPFLDFLLAIFQRIKGVHICLCLLLIIIIPPPAKKGWRRMPHLSVFWELQGLLIVYASLSETQIKGLGIHTHSTLYIHANEAFWTWSYKELFLEACKPIKKKIGKPSFTGTSLTQVDFLWPSHMAPASLQGRYPLCDLSCVPPHTPFFLPMGSC